MDGLALLCNLFADGPASLRSLRSIGIRSLSGVRAVPEASLASILKTSNSHARRFVFEARALEARLAEMPLEPELRPSPDTEAPVEGALAPIHPLTFTGRRTPQAFDVQPLESEHDEPLPPGPEPVVERAAADGGHPAEPSEIEARTEDAPTEPEPLDRVLRRHELPGLDTRTCEALVHEGVRTYGALIELASLSLARRTKIPFTRLLDLRYAAERFLAHFDATDAREVGAAEPSSPVHAPTTGAEPIVVVVPPARPSHASDHDFAAPEEATPFRFDARTPDAPSLERDEVCDDPGVSGPFV